MSSDLVEPEDERRSIQLTRMEERAVRENWPMSDKVRAKIVKRQVKIAVKAASNRESTAAAKCLVTMSKQDQDANQPDSTPTINAPNSQIILQVPDNGRGPKLDDS